VGDEKMNDTISLDKVSKSLNGREILKSIGFSVNRGDIFGYLGPNGAGKTTTIRVILGLFQPTAGKVHIMGKSVEDGSVRKKIGFVLEADGLYDNLTAYGNLEYYCQIYDVPQDQRRGRIEEMLELVDLTDRSSDKVSIYSKGMRQKLALARAMVHDPEVLILDEPTAGVDPTGQIEVRQIMLDLAQKGKTIFFSSHNLDEVQRICNRIALIHYGKIKLQGELDKLQREMGGGKVLVETAEALNKDLFPDLNLHFGLQERKEKMLIFSPEGNVDVSDIIGFLTQHGVKIKAVKRKEVSLEEIYTAMVKEAEG
jgi:ABC-type multidrug transport system, ATPase component